MKEAFKIFVKDYWDLTKHSTKFCKTHWKGLLIISGCIVGLEYVLLVDDYRIKKARIDAMTDAVIADLNRDADEAIETIWEVVKES